MDDGSDDAHTLEILDQLDSLFGDRLTTIRCSMNFGPSHARNRGWQHSSQPFVAFLDSDDAWHHQKLEMQLPIMLSTERPAISGHPFTVFPDIGGPDESRPALETRAVTYRRALFLNPFSTPSVIVRRDISERFDPSKRFSEDYDLWLRILRHHGNGKKLGTPLCILFKAPVADSGLSSQIMRMEAGQASVFRDLHNSGDIAWPVYALVRAWAAARFVRRVLLVGIGRWGRRLQGR